MREQKSSMISVIVPVFNIDKYIQRCIESIINQSYENIEIILTDDGSADRSATILDEIAGAYSNVIVIHKPNAGVTQARLDGVQIAQGENIGFCDGDDEIEPYMYERLLENKIRYNADISHCGHKVIYTDGREKFFYNTGRLAQQDREEGLKELLSGSFEPGLCSKLYSKTLLHSLLHSGKMDYNIKNNEDLLMNYFLFRLANKTVFEDFCPYHYLKREGSASRSGLNEHQIWDPIKVKQIIKDDCVETNLECFARSAYIGTCLNVYHGLINAEETSKEKKEIFNLIKENSIDLKYMSSNRRQYVFLLLSHPKIYNVVRRIYVVIRKCIIK